MPVLVLGGWAPHTRSACFRSSASPRARGLGAAHLVVVLPQLCQSSSSGAGCHTPGRHASAAMPVLAGTGRRTLGRRASAALPTIIIGGRASHTRSACFCSSASPHPRGLGTAHQVGVLPQLCQSSSGGEGGWALHTRSACFRSSASPRPQGLGAASQVGVLL